MIFKNKITYLYKHLFTLCCWNGFKGIELEARALKPLHHSNNGVISQKLS